MSMKRLLVAGFAVIAIAASAQEFPTQAVRFINGYTPGGGSDTTGRMFAERLGEMWNQAAIVENRPGAGGTIAADAVNKLPADGQTVLIFANSLLISQVVYPNMSVNMLTDFVPLALVTNAPLVLVVNPSQIDAKDLKGFTAMIRAAPGKYSYTACNVAGAPHFGMELYKSALKLDAIHVPHKGCGPATADLVAGHITIGAVTLATALPFIRQGRLRAIALMSAGRSSAAPEIPTMRESGMPELKDYAFENYYGFMVRRGTPSTVLRKLEGDILKVAATPAFREKVQNAGLEMFVYDTRGAEAFIKADLAATARVARESNIKAE